MANKLRGEATLRASGKSYRLRFSVNAICEMEAATGKGVVELTEQLSNVKLLTITAVRAALWAALRESHPDMSLEDVGELIGGAGGLPKVLPVISEAFSSAFPEGDEDEGDRPRKGVGTGSAS